MSNSDSIFFTFCICFAVSVVPFPPLDSPMRRALIHITTTAIFRRTTQLPLRHVAGRSFFSMSSPTITTTTSSFFTQRRPLSTTTTTSTTDDDDSEDNNKESSSMDEEEVVEEEQGPVEPAYDEKNPVHQGDTLYVRQRREFNKQLSTLRKDFVVDPTVQDGAKIRKAKNREKNKKYINNKYRIKALLRPPPELAPGWEDAKRRKRERHEMMTRVQEERKGLSVKYAALRKKNIIEFQEEERKEEHELMKMGVLNGWYLTREEDIDSWIERELSDTSMQNPPEHIQQNEWNSWAAFEDEEGDEFLGEGGNNPEEYFFGNFHNARPSSYNKQAGGARRRAGQQKK